MKHSLILIRPNLLFIICSFFMFHFTACKTAKEKEVDTLQSNLKTYFIAHLADSTSSVDSFRLIKIDTLTEVELFGEQYQVLSKQLKSLLGLYSLNTQNLSNSVSQMRLYRMIGSTGLVEIQRNDIKKITEKGGLMMAEIDTVVKIIDVIAQKEERADTLKPVGFEARCFYQLRNKDKSVKRDTTYVQLNVNKDIVKRKDFIKLPYDVKFDF